MQTLLPFAQLLAQKPPVDVVQQVMKWYSNELNDPEVADFAWILGVPDTVRKESRKAAFEVLVRVYGDAHVPFHLGIASPEEAENRFGDVYKRTA